MNGEHPKAIASGKLFGGTVDCYVLADKRRVISRRGIARALSSAGESDAPEMKDLGRALARLPSKYAGVATPPTVTFTRPSGGIAHGITAEQFYEILVAYSEAADLGEITHPGQLRIAANCNRLVRACGKLGIVALVDEASGYQAERAPDELQTLVARYLRDDPGDWNLLWDRKVVQRLCDLYGVERRGNLFPAFAGNVIGRIYDLILPPEVSEAVRERNGAGDERKGKLHQFFRDSLWRFVHNDIPTVAFLAKISRTKGEFWGHMRARYADGPAQFGLDFDEADS